MLEYVAFNVKPITRAVRAASARLSIHAGISGEQKSFLDFVLAEYVKTGVQELDQTKLPALLLLRYKSIPDATADLGDVPQIRESFLGFQKWLYA